MSVADATASEASYAIRLDGVEKRFGDHVVLKRISLEVQPGQVVALIGKKMGTVDGYLWNKEFQGIYGSDLKVYPTPTAMYTDLKAGRIEVAADSFGSATYANKQNGDKWKVEVPEADPRVATSQQAPQVCFPMSKNNEALYAAVNDDLETLRSSGKLADILGENGLDPSAADAGDLKLIQ